MFDELPDASLLYPAIPVKNESTDTDRLADRQLGNFDNPARLRMPHEAVKNDGVVIRVIRVFE